MNSARVTARSSNSSSRFRHGFSPSLVRKSVNRERRLPERCQQRIASEVLPLGPGSDSSWSCTWRTAPSPRPLYRSYSPRIDSISSRMLNRIARRAARRVRPSTCARRRRRRDTTAAGDRRWRGRWRPSRRGARGRRRRAAPARRAVRDPQRHARRMHRRRIDRKQRLRSGESRPGRPACLAPRDNAPPPAAAAAGWPCGCVSPRGKSNNTSPSLPDGLESRRRSPARAARRHFAHLQLALPPTATSALCGTLIVPKHRLEKRRSRLLEHLRAGNRRLAGSAIAAAPARCSSTSTTLASA